MIVPLAMQCATGTKTGVHEEESENHRQFEFFRENTLTLLRFGIAPVCLPGRPNCDDPPAESEVTR